MHEQDTVFHSREVSISPFSRASVHIEMLRITPEGEEIAKADASGFHWEHNGLLHLITNWHVITGLNPENGLSIGSFVPNAIRTTFFVERPVDPTNLGGKHLLACVGNTQLLGNEDPLEGWLCHPNGKEVDLVALPMEWQVSDHYCPVCLNLTKIQLAFQGEVGDDVFIVGFPEGTSFDRKLPLWKRGTIATDVSLNQNSKPQYLVDTIGNKGLSGSFVLHKNRVALIGDENGVVNNRFSFAGIYAGRLGEKGIRSQIGRVIKPDALLETLNCGKANKR